MLRERRGTCSTKHLFLAQRLAKRFPETDPLIVHRVYRLDHATAQQRYGEHVAQTVPEDSGLVDVHRYLTIHVDGQHVTVDATFPGPCWDGHSSLPLACGPEDDHPAEEDPDTEKLVLESDTAIPPSASRSSRRWLRGTLELIASDSPKVPRLALRREERDQRERPPRLVEMPSALAARTTLRSKETAVAPVCLAVASR